MLNALIVCNDLPVLHNQRRLTKAIMDEKGPKDKILITLESRTADKIMITFNNELEYNYVSIENLKNKSKKEDGEKIFKYVVNLIKFIGNLCLGNNILAIEFFKEIYQLDTCVRIITNSVLSSELRAAFAHLIHHMWFKSGEQSQFRKSQFFCKVWDTIDIENTDPADTEEILLTLWNYIKNYLDDILKMWQFDMFNKTDFEFLNSLLMLTTDLLLGDVLLENDIEKLRISLQDMLFCTPNDSSTLSSIEQDLTTCKALLIDTIQVIHTFDFNLFVQSLLRQVKQGANMPASGKLTPDIESLQDVDDSQQRAIRPDRDDILEEPRERKPKAASSRPSLLKDRLIRGVSRQ